MPSDSLLKELYSGDYEFRVDCTSLRRFKETAQSIIKKMMQLQPMGVALLDIGTGYGTFVEIALLNGLDAIGIEPSRSLYRLAHAKLKSGILHSDLYGFSRNCKKRFDFISAIHVIEHQKDPKKFFTTLFKLLKPGGVLYIETPNSYGHLAMAEKENYTFLTPPDHIHLFSKKSFEMMFSKLNQTIVCSYITYSYPEHLVGILRTIKNGKSYKHKARKREVSKKLNRGVLTENNLPFFDRNIAPLLTPLLNLGNRGSFLQIFIQKKN